MFNFSMPELILILIIALVVFGPGKLPEVGKAIGKGIQEFRRASSGESSNAAYKEEPEKITARPTDAPIEATIVDTKAQEEQQSEKK